MSTFLSTQKSGLTLRSTFLSGSTLESALLEIWALLGGLSFFRSFFSSSIILNLKIASAPHDTHGDHLDDHFPKKVEVDHVIDYLGIVI